MWAFALGVPATRTTMKYCLRQCGVRAGKDSIEWLARDHLVELEKPEIGCLALYFHHDVWAHIGVVTAHNRITSQWGTFPIYTHEIFEVPTSYGDAVRYYIRPNDEEAYSLFIEYAKTKMETRELETVLNRART